MSGSVPPGVCIVGCGGYAAVHARNFRKLGSRLFFASRDPTRARTFAERFGGIGLGRLAAAVRDDRVHGVVVCTPPDRHLPDAEAALAAGRTVLLEKPVARTVAEGERIADAVRNHDGVLMLAENYALLPALAVMRRTIASGRIGVPRRVSVCHRKRFPVSGWRCDRSRTGGGILIDLGVHYLRFLQRLLGPVRRVGVREIRHGIEGMEGESGIEIDLAWDDRLTGTFEVSWDREWDRSLSNVAVEGDRGTVEFRMANRLLRVKASGGLPWTWVPGSDRMGRMAVDRSFLRTILTGETPEIGIGEGIEDLRVVESAYRAAESGEWEEVLPALSVREGERS